MLLNFYKKLRYKKPVNNICLQDAAGQFYLDLTTKHNYYLPDELKSIKRLYYLSMYFC